MGRYLAKVIGLIVRVILFFCTLRNSYKHMTYSINTVLVKVLIGSSDSCKSLGDYPKEADSANKVKVLKPDT
jgi:hypothetical protein